MVAFLSVLGDPVELCVDSIPESGDSLTVGVLAFAVVPVIATGLMTVFGGRPRRLIGTISAVDSVFEGTPFTLPAVLAEATEPVAIGDSVFTFWLASV